MVRSSAIVSHVLRLAALALLLLAFAAQGRAADAVLPMPARVIAIGDLHGDYPAWRTIAQAAGLIDRRGKWRGGTATLVQTGDVVDRGPNSRAIIRDLMRLQREARRAGGQVFALVGNHEAMNVIGDLRYVSPGEYAAFANTGSQRLRDAAFAANHDAIAADFRRENPGASDARVKAGWLAATPLGKTEHRLAWAPGGEIGKWVIGNPAIVRLGDTLFVHAGLSAAYADKAVDAINRDVAAALAARNTADASIINAQDGPLWYRGLAGEAPKAGAKGPAPADELALVLRRQQAEHIVIGHTPVLAGVEIRHGGRLVMIDTGISAAYGGTLGYLEIVDGRLVPHIAKPSGPTR